MKFPSPLAEGILLKRYKRFLADVLFPDGHEETVHCPNPGAMLGVAPEGARCWVSRSPNKARKLPLTLEIVECPGTDGLTMVGVNTHLPNAIAEEAIKAGKIKQLSADHPLRREVRYGEEKSRIDILLEGPTPIWVEVKNCHLLRRQDGVAEFPDCVTARGLKHLRELIKMVKQGDRAVMLFIIQREDISGFAPADDLDPAYGQGLRMAANAGVEIIAYDCTMALDDIAVRAEIPVFL